MFTRFWFNRIGGLVAATILVASCVMSAHAQVIQPWPMAGQNAQRTGEALAIGPVSQLTEIWSLPLAGSNTFVGSTALYNTSPTLGLTAVNFNGTLKWILTPWTGGDPAIGPDGTVYVAGDASYSDVALYAINPEGLVVDGILDDSAIKWSIPFTVLGGIGPLCIDDAGCIFANGYKIAPDGTFLWGGRRVPALGGSTVVAINDKGTPDTSDDILYSTDAYHLYAFKSSDGSALWTRAFKINVNNAIHADAIVGNDGTAYLTTHDFILWAINPATGATKWQASVGNKQKPWVWCSAQPAVDNVAGVIYCGGYDSFYAFNKNTGQLKWKKSLPSNHARPVIGFDGTVYLSEGGVLYAMKSANGATLWSVNAGNPVIGLDGTLYSNTSDGLKAYQD